MQNINTERQNVLENINIGSMIETFNPSSMQGSTLKKNLSEAFNSGNIQRVSTIIDIVVECMSLRHVDTASYAMYESLSEKLNESIKTKLIYCVESLDTLRSNPLHESLRNTLDQMIVLEEADIVNKIRSGALSAYKTVESVKFIIESVQIKTDTNAVTESHLAYHPVSYTEISENHTAFIRLHNQVFAINEDKLYMVNSPSPKFSFLSSVVENLKFDHVNESFSISHDTLGKFTISEHKITRQPVGSDEILEHATCEELRSDVSIIIESLGTSNSRDAKQKVNENKKFIDAITAVQENFDSISLADNVVIIESLKYQEKFAFVTNGDASHVITLKSNRMPNVVESFNDLRNGLQVLEKKSGYDAKHFFTKQLIQIQENDQSTQEKINGLNLIIEKLDAKTENIKKMIAEEKSATILNEGKIEKLNEALALNEAHAFEQRSNLSALLN